LYPKLLAELSGKEGCLLVHFSTNAFFDDEKGDYYIESGCPKPISKYTPIRPGQGMERTIIQLLY
jgi:dTDP-4-dehydrorhamnose reductase